METADSLSHRVASFSYYLDTAKDHTLLHRVSSAQETTPPNIANALISSNPTMIKPQAPFTIKFSKPKEIQDSTNLRVDSFSYRNTTRDNNNNNNNFVFETPGPTQDPTSSFAFEKVPNKDGEIGVFGADRYFNMKLEYKTEPKNTSSYTRELKNPTQKPGPNNKLGPRTPSLSSEASSAWNSQTALLPGAGDLHRYGSQTKHNTKRASGRRIFTGYFGCKGPCFDKKSVHINEVVADGSLYGSKPARNGSQRIENPEMKPVLSTIKVQDLDELTRNSIEVFGSSTQSTHKGDVATNMERKLSMLTWDAIPNKGQVTSAPPTSHGSTTTIICDADRASDASSDLFEIENISGSSVYPLILKSSDLLPRDDDDNRMSSRISHYAPSEASIQWSVVTASAADYSINHSDYNNDEMSVSVAGDLVSRANAASKTRNQGGREGQKIRPGGLLGCKSDKSVDVVKNASHKANEKVTNPSPDFSVSFGKTGRAIDMDHALKSPRSLPMVL